MRAGRSVFLLMTYALENSKIISTKTPRCICLSGSAGAVLSSSSYFELTGSSPWPPRIAQIQQKSMDHQLPLTPSHRPVALGPDLAEPEETPLPLLQTASGDDRTPNSGFLLDPLFLRSLTKLLDCSLLAAFFAAINISVKWLNRIDEPVPTRVPW